MTDPATGTWLHFIAGEWVEGVERRRLDLHDPATTELIGHAARATEPDVERAVAAARKCVTDRTLTAMRPVERGRMLVAMATWLRDHRSDIARTLTLDSGKTLTESQWEIDTASGFLEYYGGLTDKLEGSYIPLGDGYTDYVMPIPYGVSAHIIPWNYPLEISARGIGPALAAGNAVVVKSPELDPAAVTYLARAAEEVGLPAGAVNVIAGHGHDAGAALTRHPDVDQITFTGSVETGRAILHAAADSITPAVVELGGKSPGIVLPDADLDVVTEQTRWGIYSNSGQVCSALSRLLVPEPMRDEIVDRVVAMSQAIAPGPGLEDPDMGPLISHSQLERVDRFVRTAREDGAVVATGGAPVDDLSGHFYQPTVLVNVNNDMAIARQEVFGPVLCVIPYDSTDDALSIANDSDYGLVAGLFSNDMEQVLHLAARLDAGQIFVNEWFQPAIEAPFGGFKHSGFGREKGRAAVESYFHWKNVNLRH